MSDASERDWSAAGWWTAGVLAAGVLVLLVLRLLHSVDLTDESYYAATAYRFALGGRPLIDDWSPQQLAALLTSPFVRLHLAVFGDTTGLILSLRLLWLAMTAAAGAVMWAALRHVVRPVLALAAVAACLPFCPFLIMAPSYDTIAIAGLAVGVAGGIGALGGGRPRRWAAVAGVGFAVAAIAYPTMSVLLVVAAVWLCVRHRERILPFVLGAAVPLLPLAVVLALNVSGLRDMLAYVASLAGYGGAGAKLSLIFTGAASFLVRSAAFWFALVCLAWALWKRRPLPAWAPLTAAALSVVALGVAAADKTQYVAAALLVAALSWVAWPRTRTECPTDDESVLVWAIGIGLVAAALFSYTSTNGFGNFGLGALAVMPVLLGVAAGRLSLSTRREWVALSLVALVAASGLFLAWRASYRDVPPLQQTARIASGPYAGLSTTPGTAATVVRMQADLRAVVRPGDRLLAYDRVPAAYLMTDAMPAAPMLWTDVREETMPATFRAFLLFVEQPAHRPTIALRNDSTPEVPSQDGFVDGYVTQHMSLVATRTGYSVFRAR